MDIKTPWWARAIPISMALLVAVASFVLSFSAMREVAVSVGAVSPELSFWVPLVVDGSILSGSASIWAASMRPGARRDWLAYIITAAALGLSIVINIHHHDDLLARVVSGTPPVALLATLELVAAAARRDVVEAAKKGVPQRADDDPSEGSNAESISPASAIRGPAPTQVSAAPAAAPQARPQLEAPAAQTVAAAAPPRPAVSAPVKAEPKAKPVAPRPAPAKSGESPQADRIAEAYAAHLAAGGDPKDPALARQISEALDIPIPSVRKVLGPLRRADAEAPALQPVS